MLAEAISDFLNDLHDRLRAIGFRSYSPDRDYTVWHRGDARVELAQPLEITFNHLRFTVRVICKLDELDEILYTLPNDDKLFREINVWILRNDEVKADIKLTAKDNIAPVD